MAPLPDPANLRTLAETELGYVLIPTHVPDGMKIVRAGSLDSDSGRYFDFEVYSAEDGSVLSVGLHQREDGDMEPGRVDGSVDDERFNIDGQVWSTWLETGAATIVGPYLFVVDQWGVDESTLEMFVAGLRVGAPSEFPGFLFHSGAEGELSVVDGAASATGEIVAADDLVNVTLATQDGQMCVWLRDNSPEAPHWSGHPECGSVPNEPVLIGHARECASPSRCVLGQGRCVARATTFNRVVAVMAQLGERGTPMRYFDDLEVGMVLWGDEVTVDRDEMISFAERFDPQPMHLSDSEAQAIGLDGVVASGSFTWALSALSMQGMVREGLALLPGGLKMEISFTAPVVAGDRLRLRAEVAELRASSKGGRGYARMTQQFVNEQDVAAMEIDATWVIATRD